MDTDSTGGKAPDPEPKRDETFPKEIRLKYDVQPINDLAHAINEHKNAQQVRKNSKDGVEERQATAQEKATRIGRTSMYVSCALGGLTILALIINAWAVHQATRAADAADSTVSIYRTNLQWDSAKNAKATFTDSVRFQKQFDLNKKTADSQIRTMQGTLAETKREFKKLNEPYLQFDFKGIDSPIIGRNPTIFFDIENLGKYAVQIVQTKSSSGIQVNVPVFDSVYPRMSIDAATSDEYVTEGHPLKNMYSTDIYPLTPSEFKELHDPKYFYYFVGYFRYRNLITKEYKVYQVIIQYNYVSRRFWYRRNKNFVDSAVN